MRANSFDRYFGFTFFGESHGPAMGIVIEDVIPNIDFPYDDLKIALAKRRPGKNFISSARKEEDDFEIISGLFEGKTTGMPICILFKNNDFASKDYENIKNVFRPGHADYSWYKKFKIYDYRGGGRASGRETISRVAAGAYVKKVLKNITINSYPVQIGKIKAGNVNLNYCQNNFLSWPDANNFHYLIEYLKDIKKQGDSIGAIVEVVIDNLPIGLGDPVIEKLDANLAKALLSIGGVKGVEFGDGFLLANMCGSQSNDPMYMKDEHNEKKVCFKTNHLGGIQGGVSTGNQLTLRLSIKAVPSIEKTQKTINKEEKEVDLLIKGRHDVCLIPRILPVIDSMISLTLADAISHQKLVSSNDTDLNDLREAIEKIDEDFLIALYRRNQISKRIGDYKKKNNLQVYDKMRERFLLDSLSGKAKAYNLSESFIRELWSLIMTESKKQQ